jgi:hypothetical protein
MLTLFKGTGVAQLRTALATTAVKCKVPVCRLSLLITGLPPPPHHLYYMSTPGKFALELVPRFYLDLFDAVKRVGKQEPIMTFDSYKTLAYGCHVPMSGGKLAAVTKVSPVCVHTDEGVR